MQNWIDIWSLRRWVSSSRDWRQDADDCGWCVQIVLCPRRPGHSVHSSIDLQPWPAASPLEAGADLLSLCCHDQARPLWPTRNWVVNIEHFWPLWNNSYSTGLNYNKTMHKIWQLLMRITPVPQVTILKQATKLSFDMKFRHWKNSWLFVSATFFVRCVSNSVKMNQLYRNQPK